ncbi:MAG: threonine synthase [Spirochaetaceae bacterium]
MRFLSTRDEHTSVSFREAVFRGLAPDGGLFHPATDLDLKSTFLELRPSVTFTEVARIMTAALFPEELSGEQIERIVSKAFPFRPELRRLTDGVHLLELFHGPSCAFKDYGASYLAAVMEEFLAGEDARAVILTATSGDTGSAVAQAFHGRRNIDVVVLYPSGRVSPLQEKQLTTLGGNIHALEVDGSFDDCQRMVKEAFLDEDLRAVMRLTSANSINLGRLIPQVFYYVYAFAKLKEHVPGELFFCVPSGNFGNLTAGVLAWKWGMPVTGFIAATNVNDVVPSYLETGVFSPRSSVRTLSNAMDVGNPSNFERLQAIFAGDVEAMRAMIAGEVVTDEETKETIAYFREKENVFLDPHTAAGVRAAQRFRARHDPQVDTIVTLGTAHPGKFGEIVEEATGARPEIPKRLARVLDLEKQATLIANEPESLKTYLLERFGGV